MECEFAPHIDYLFLAPTIIKAESDMSIIINE